MKKLDTNGHPGRKNEQLIVVAKPSPTEGVGKALRAAYRAPFDELPRDLADCLARLS